MKIFKKGDIVIIISIIILSFVPILFMKKEVKNGNAKIVITQDNKVIGQYVVNESKQSKYIDFEFVVKNKTYKGQLETKNSMVRLLRLPEEVVPKSIHSDMSWISNDSKIIVALPVKLVVYIENSDKKDEVDAIST